MLHRCKVLPLGMDLYHICIVHHRKFLQWHGFCYMDLEHKDQKLINKEKNNIIDDGSAVWL